MIVSDEKSKSFKVCYYGKDYSLDRDFKTFERLEALLSSYGIQNGIMNLFSASDGKVKECNEIVSRLKISECRSINCAMLGLDVYPNGDQNPPVVVGRSEVYGTADILYGMSGRPAL